MGHFSELPGLQDTINFDPDSTDFYPGQYLKTLIFSTKTEI
jgi:hypothetical protein